MPQTTPLPCSLRGLLLVLAGTMFVVSPLQASERTLIRAKKLYPGDGPPLEPAAVLIKDGRIVRIAEAIKVDEGVHVEDYPEGILLPGLIDAYSHYGVSGGDAESTSEVTPDFRVESAIDWNAIAFRAAVANGVTAAVIAPGTDNVFAGIGIVAKTAGDVNDRIVQPDLGMFITMASDARNRNRSRVRPDSIYVRQPTNRMGVVWILRSTLDRALRNTPNSNAVVREIFEGNHKLFFVSRTHFDVESVLRLSEEFGLEPIVTRGREAFQAADRLAAQKIPVILDPIITGTAPGVEGTRPAWNRAGMLHAAGVEFALSGSRLLDQARFAVRFGLPAEVALRSITVTPAKILGVGDRVGSLAVGRDADLVVLNGEPLEFTSAIEAVFVNGRKQP